jgi:hypothetical protein
MGNNPIFQLAQKQQSTRIPSSMTFCIIYKLVGIVGGVGIVTGGGVGATTGARIIVKLNDNGAPEKPVADVFDQGVAVST